MGFDQRALTECSSVDRGAASEEVARLVQTDQDARQGVLSAVNWEALTVADRQRRVRVSELFAMGCLSTARDYAAAALIFQHGQIPEHYIEAFLFASRAVALGDVAQKSLMAKAIDRFLVTTGHRQLFGTNELVAHDYSCLWPVEPGFPDERRREYLLSQTIEERRADVRKRNEHKQGCSQVECDYAPQPTPRGSLPGVW